MIFVLTWIFSGWLSMDHGLLFSTGKPTATESVTIAGAPVWDNLSSHEIGLLPKQAREIEWFAFNGRIYRRERFDLTSQRLSLTGDGSVPEHVFLQSNEVSAGARRLAPDCSRIRLASLPRGHDESRLLWMMGWDTANIHLGTPKQRRAILLDLGRRKRGWLPKAAARMTETVTRDWRKWGKITREE